VSLPVIDLNLNRCVSICRSRRLSGNSSER
jgi:hypothetical protein